MEDFAEEMTYPKSWHIICVFFHVCNAMNLLIWFFSSTCYLYLLLINQLKEQSAVISCS